MEFLVNSGQVDQIQWLYETGNLVVRPQGAKVSVRFWKALRYVVGLTSRNTSKGISINRFNFPTSRFSLLEELGSLNLTPFFRTKLFRRSDRRCSTRNVSWFGRSYGRYIIRIRAFTLSVRSFSLGTTSGALELEFGPGGVDMILSCSCERKSHEMATPTRRLWRWSFGNIDECAWSLAVSAWALEPSCVTCHWYALFESDRHSYILTVGYIWCWRSEKWQRLTKQREYILQRETPATLQRKSATH